MGTTYKNRLKLPNNRKLSSLQLGNAYPKYGYGEHLGVIVIPRAVDGYLQYTTNFLPLEKVGWRVFLFLLVTPTFINGL